MDDKQPTTPTASGGQIPPTGGQVMDIATPGSQVVEPTSANQPVAQTPSFSANPEPVSAPSPAALPQAPASPSETSVAEPSSIGLTMSSNSEPMHEAPGNPSNPGEVKPEMPDTGHGGHGGHHSGAPVAAIVIAVVVAVALAGVVIFGYMKARDNGAINRSDNTNTNTDTVAEKPQASVADVDDATTEIDNGLKSTDDATDFATTDLSDSTLGL